MAGRNPETPEIERPRRPVLIEAAAAILIIGSVMDLLFSVEAAATASTALGRALATTSIVLAVLLVVLGTLIRRGRGWLVTLNVVAVAAFLELQSLSIPGIFAAIFDMVVVGILLRERWWFQWRPPEEGAAGRELDRGPERA